MIFVKLKDILEKNSNNFKISETKFEELARQFQSRSKEIKSFLNSSNKARDFEKRKSSSTYLILNDKKTTIQWLVH